jgi:hypothetical protein
MVPRTALTRLNQRGSVHSIVRVFSGLRRKWYAARPAAHLHHTALTITFFRSIAAAARIAGALTSQGYNVTFREFDGDHEIPADVAREGLRWVTE